MNATRSSARTTIESGDENQPIGTFSKHRCEDRTISDGIQTPTVAHFPLWRVLCAGGRPLKAHGTRASEKITPRRTTTCRRQPRREGEGLPPAQCSGSASDEVETRCAQRHAVQATVANRARVDRVPRTLTLRVRSTDVASAHQTPAQASTVGRTMIRREHNRSS